MYFHGYNMEVSVKKWNPQSKTQTHTHTPQQKKKNKTKKITWEHKLYVCTDSFHASSSQLCPFPWPFALSLIRGLCICGLLLRGQ